MKQEAVKEIMTPLKKGYEILKKLRKVLQKSNPIKYLNY